MDKSSCLDPLAEYQVPLEVQLKKRVNITLFHMSNNVPHLYVNRYLLHFFAELNEQLKYEDW